MTAPDRPRWSVVIPVHNCADYLAETLPEVVAQLADSADAEIIVVDDASSDDPAAGGRAARSGPGRTTGRTRAISAPSPRSTGASSWQRGELVHLLHGDDMVLSRLLRGHGAGTGRPDGGRRRMPGPGRGRRQHADLRHPVLSEGHRRLEERARRDRGVEPGPDAGDRGPPRGVRAGRRLSDRPAACRRLGDVDPARGARTRRVRRPGARLLPAPRHLGHLGAGPDRGQHPGAGHRDRGDRRPRRAEPTGSHHPESAGVRRRVRHPSGARSLSTGNWSAAGRQGREAIRCAWLLPRGVPISPDGQRTRAPAR